MAANKSKEKDKVLVTAWVPSSLRTQANIAAQLTGISVTDSVLKALEDLIAKSKKVEV